MDPLQARLARIGLQVAGTRGFVLAGGHAVGLHGMGARPSEDIDLFTAERGSPAAIADDLIGAYQREGFTVTVSLRAEDLVQMEVADAGGHSCKVDLGVSWRSRWPQKAVGDGRALELATRTLHPVRDDALVVEGERRRC